MSRKKGRLKNPYLKTILWAAVGACIGFMLVLLFQHTDGAVEAIKTGASAFIRKNAAFLLILDIFLLLAISLGTYIRVELLMKKDRSLEQTEGTDMEAEGLECRMEQMGTLSMVCNHTLFLLLFIILSAYLEVVGRGKAGSGMVVLLFLLGGVIFSIWEIAYVRQCQRRDPTKKGDPSDLRFNKEWLKSCDEAERQIIYQSAYKTFRRTQSLLLLLLILTLSSNLFWNTGMLPVVLTAGLSAFMTGSYAVTAMRLRKLE